MSMASRAAYRLPLGNDVLHIKLQLKNIKTTTSDCDFKSFNFLPAVIGHLFYGYTEIEIMYGKGAAP
jgi:hypothetical protein